MVKKSYEWVSGAKLEDHSRRKHKILREYFFSYLRVRCQHPQQSRFRLAVVDGFAGGGRYSCGTAGSPVIFLEVLKNATDFVNTHRLDQGLGAIDIECLLVLNDADRNVVELLKSIVGPLCAVIAQTVPRLHIHVEYLNNTFEMAYPAIKTILFQGRYRNVLFNRVYAGLCGKGMESGGLEMSQRWSRQVGELAGGEIDDSHHLSEGSKTPSSGDSHLYPAVDRLGGCV